MKKTIGLLAALIAAALLLSACTATDDAETAGETATASDGSVFASVKEAGLVRCGTRDALVGFAVLQEDGTHVGFDSDFCRVIAAAVFGDAAAVEMVALETADRFKALQDGSIDVLVRNTTWSASFDGKESLTFAQITFYDGEGMMVDSGSGYKAVSDMNDAVICVAKGTTSEVNVAGESTRLGLGWKILTFDSNEQIKKAFDAGECQGWTSDVSQLTALRATYPVDANSPVILPEVFSKEPLAPAVLDGDTQWAQVVNWAVLATIAAEEFGITSANVDSFLTSEDENIQSFLGVAITTDSGESVFNPGLGLPTDFAYQIVKQVGNYGEIYDRHLTPLGLERGANALWIDGGLMYSPPFR